MAAPSLSEERSELGRSLLARNAMSPDWVDAFRAVPRAAFLPDVMWPFDMATGQNVRVDRREDPEAWLRYADEDVPIVTQWDDHDGDDAGTVPTSSASMPSVVFRMLAALDIEPGHRVLEIGTGTGWTAALLSHRLGRENVVSIEIDSAVAAAARQRLAQFGAPVLVLERDGEEGDEPGAPYDRVIATAGVRRIPPAWIRDTVLGGKILAPWGTHFSNADALVRLTLSEDGKSCSGNFLGPVEFMKLRAQRSPFAGHDAYVREGTAGADRSTTDAAGKRIIGEGRFDPATFAVGLRVRDCRRSVAAARGGARPVWFYGLDDRSWACVMFRDGQEADVWQDGPRRLWDEACDALDWWRAAGEPGFERFGLTVTEVGAQRVWLDSPEDSWPV